MNNARRPYEHVVSESGGVDSGAAFLLAVERGRPFIPVFADTGNEDSAVYDHLAELEAYAGIAIRRVRADLSHRFARRREFIRAKWPAKGVPPDKVDRALAIMHPTGNPFLDLCMLKGRFPSSGSRFCTQELKVLPLFEQAHLPLLRAGKAVISWQGVRADESLARSLLPRWQRLEVPVGVRIDAADREAAARWRLYAYRPLLSMRKSDCFAIYERHGLRPNRLYEKGFGRVGCMLCIMARKDEVRLAASVCPEHIERLAEWERIVSEVSKRDCATFFAVSDDPLWDRKEEPSLERFGIHARVEWSKTSRGGRQYDLTRIMDPAVEFNTPCNQWGACES